MRKVRLVVFVMVIFPVLVSMAFGQLTSADIEALKARGLAEGWTFTVGENSATKRPLSQLCGLVEPANWRATARFDPCQPKSTLPATFDWRTLDGVTPIKDQGNCGSCWAFATVGALECNIKIKDHIETDLSEQWLVSCNTNGWGCNGGWWAHDYHQWKADPCGDSGAVPEYAFPYAAADLPCNCPYPHEYWIQSWAYIGSDSGVPPVEAIKQAIMDYGPVCVAVYAGPAFQAYTGGIFNACEIGEVNHAVMLVGWDDNQGPNGVWFLRNSWGTEWGEGGYMRITYNNCNLVGYAACYVNYEASDPLQVTPLAGFNSKGPVGGPFTPSAMVYTLFNNGIDSLNWTATATQNWITIEPSNGNLAPGASIDVTVSINSNANTLSMGQYTDVVTFTNTNTANTRARGVKLRVMSQNPYDVLILTPDVGSGGGSVAGLLTALEPYTDIDVTVWDPDSKGEPSVDDLLNYDVVIV
ncbi:MAG: hypothetical protein N2246_08260, partial [Candidatus Sumerlaeia bacterium]|nr:hypothetical protein [Candidatus Sumerlaeia bacterium]